MSAPFRLARGGLLIDRARPLSFRFDGRDLRGLAGDSLASALLANGVRLVGRSFKLHRPRGVVGAGVEDPCALVDLLRADGREPNRRATMTPLEDGLVAAAVNAWPSAACDLGALQQALHRFMPAGFYYKTFLGPAWRLWEGIIRRRAGLGRIDAVADERRYAQRHAHCDVLIVGAGPAGLAAALAVAESGLRLVLVDDGAIAGGSLLWDDEAVDGLAAADWIARSVAALRAAPNVRLLARTTVTGLYDHGAAIAVEARASAPPGWAREVLWKIRARATVLATGAFERPLPFADNDRPGVMLASAVRRFAMLHAVVPGRRAVIATNNDDAYRTAVLLAELGIEVAAIVDARPSPHGFWRDRAAAKGLRIASDSRIARAEGGRALAGVALAGAQAGERIGCDLLAVSGGFSPAVHLHCQAGGALAWSEALASLVPFGAPDAIANAGAASGAMSPDEVLASGHLAGLAAIARCGGRVTTGAVPRAAARALDVVPIWRGDGPADRQWLDLQNDVTLADVELAAREGYRSVEHLKRYTTLGMAPDQGKTANLPGLAALAAATSRAIPELGTTRFRPPFVPLSMGAIAGMRKGAQLHPPRRLPAMAEHEALGALFDDYGGWRRPAAYPRAGEDLQAAMRREAASVRARAGIFDASPLGKLEVRGADAARFLDLMFFNRIATLAIGRVRYVLLLNENGKIVDDGVVARLGADRFLVSPSSGHAAMVAATLEEWRQCEYPNLDVFVTDVTAAWGTIAVTGPQARTLAATLGADVDLDPRALPHMAVREGRIGVVAARIARVSFTGEAGFEISVPASYAASLWSHLLDAGNRLDAVPFGVEALLLLRAEKGYIHVGIDTDGDSEPHDLGYPLIPAGKDENFIGRRSLLRPVSRRADRRQLVGFATDDGAPLPVGAHVLDANPGVSRSRGVVTSSYWSPTLGQPIALGLLEAGRACAARGARVQLFDRGRRLAARVVTPCFYDPSGARLHG